MNAPLKKLNELTGLAFDGVRSGYVPPETLTISPKLKLHRKAKSAIDPVTFEVVRHALWNVNEEHGAASETKDLEAPAQVDLTPRVVQSTPQLEEGDADDIRIRRLGEAA